VLDIDGSCAWSAAPARGAGRRVLEIRTTTSCSTTFRPRPSYAQASGLGGAACRQRARGATLIAPQRGGDRAALTWMCTAPHPQHGGTAVGLRRPPVCGRLTAHRLAAQGGSVRWRPGRPRGVGLAAGSVGVGGVLE
jgi:hypothetical protein